jgi:two-component system LytT family sensor kinase
MAALGLWTLVGVSYALSSIVSGAAEGAPTTWRRAFAWSLSSFYLWMAATPLIAMLGRWTAGRGRARFLAVHVPASLAVSGLHTALFFALYWVVKGPGGRLTTFPELVRVDSVSQVHLGLLAYWLILAALRGLEWRRRLKDEQLRASRLEAQLAQAQLQALRMQLQPHFLFNTLQAISALALEDPHLARAMIARLGDFLRLTLEEPDNQEPSLARELQFLECYLEIQRLRFQDRLAVRLEIAPETLAAYVPHLILQPLVENALRHGLSRKTGAGELRVSTRRQGAELLLVVEDDGLGLPEGGPREGLGLGNTRNRLRARFGAAAGLELAALPGGGTRASLRLPFLAAEAAT